METADVATKEYKKEAGTILSFEREIASKQDYNPKEGSLDVQYDASLRNEFQYDLWQFQRTYPQLNDLTITDYITRCNNDFVSYVPPLRDPFDWRNYIKSSIQADKTTALLAFFIDLNFQNEPKAQDWLGNLNEKMGDASEVLLKHADLLDEYEEKNKLADLKMLVDGTVSENIQWTVRKRLEKNGKLWQANEKTEGVIFETKEVDEFEGIESKLNKLNRIYLADVTESNINKQPHKWREFVVPYETAYNMCHGYDRWKFVKPYNGQIDAWTDTDRDIVTEENARFRLVRFRVYENMPRNEYALFANGVRLTPIGMPLVSNRYSDTWTRGMILDTDFCYGKSFVAHLRREVSTRDILMSLFVDSSRQGLEPPMKSTFRTMVNRYMFAPGSVTPFQGGELSPMIPQNALNNYAIEAIKFLDQRINDASVSPIFQGQQGAGVKTKREVELLMANSIRTAAYVVSACVYRRRQRAQAFFEEILRHYTKSRAKNLSDKTESVKRFVITAGDESSKKEVLFGKMPTDKKQAFGVIQNLLQDEKTAKARGVTFKRYIVDPDEIKNFKFIFDFRVNPQQRSSKSSDMEEVVQKYLVYRQDENIDPIWRTKTLVRGYGDDVDEAVRAPQPQEPQKLQGQGQPQVPPADGQGVPQAMPEMPSAPQLPQAPQQDMTKSLA